MTRSGRAPAPAPVVFSYLGYRVFLHDWFAWKKAEFPRFSHRSFSRRAGRSSPSLLLDTINGSRKLTPATTVAFVGALGLDAEAGLFFTWLVDYDQAATPELRAAALEKIRATTRFREAHRLDPEALEQLSLWHVSAIVELAACQGFQSDAGWIARHLRPRIGIAEAERALDALVALGMLERDADGSVVPTGRSFVTPHEADKAALNYHLGMQERAREALVTVPSAERHFCGLTVAIPASLVAEFKRELNTLQERLLERSDGASGEKDVVYQLNLSLFPLTERCK